MKSGERTPDLGHVNLKPADVAMNTLYERYQN